MFRFLSRTYGNITSASAHDNPIPQAFTSMSSEETTQLEPSSFRRGCSLLDTEPKRRTEIAEICTIKAFPSRGGLVVKNADIVDMTFLGFDRLSPPTEILEDQEVEDEFSQLLLRAGGKYWYSRDFWLRVRLSPDEGDREARTTRIYGWPGTVEEGVWVLESDWDYRSDQGEAEDDPPELGRLGMAINMAEKITIMKELGATFYPDAREYLPLRDALDPAWPSSSDMTQYQQRDRGFLMSLTESQRRELGLLDWEEFSAGHEMTEEH